MCVSGSMRARVTKTSSNVSACDFALREVVRVHAPVLRTANKLRPLHMDVMQSVNL